MYKILVLSFLVAPTLLPAQDQDNPQEWLGTERLRFYVQAFFPALDTDVRLDSASGEIGTTIDFEQNLGLSDTVTVPAAGFAWRFADRHRLRFDYFRLERSSASVSTSEIRFGNSVFQADLPISSFFDTDVYTLGYSYSVLSNRNAEIGLIAGLSVQDIALGIKNSRGPAFVEEESAVTAPLPSFGVTGAYLLNDKWVLRAIASYFALELSLSDEEDIGGEIINLEAGIEYLVSRNVSIDLRFSYFNLSANFTNERCLTEIKCQYRGPKLGIIGRI